MSVGENSIDLLSNLAETALDAVTENEILREIPILGTAVGIARLGRDLRDRAFLNKIVAFLNHLPKQTPEQKARLAEEVRADTKRRIKFGDSLFTTLEQADSTVKAEYAALAFAAFLDGKIDDKKLRSLCHAIRVAQVDELVEFAERRIEALLLEKLAHTGLSTAKYPPITWDGDTAPEFQPSEIGWILRELIAQRPNP